LSHASDVHPYAGAVKVREPVARPLDVVAVELLLSASQAFLVGVLMYLAIGVWDDRGVGLGSVAIILALLGLAVGAAWLYWLFGGVGWPLAAANVPVAMFLGFAMVLGWYGENLFNVRGAPLLSAEICAIGGIIGGVFLDSPRRWRWDQRQKLRPGTQVPRVSPATQALVAQMPRSLPRRSARKEASSDLATRIEQSTPPGPEPSGDVGMPHPDGEEPNAPRPTLGEDEDGTPDADPPEGELTDAPAVQGAPIEAGERSAPTMPTERLGRDVREPGATSTDDDAEESGAIELPTSVEPKAQRSPWAWAAPPEWNRDEDDEIAGSSTSKRS